MHTVASVSEWLQSVAPLSLSEDWDNTGLLLGDPQARVERIQTCLTVTPASASEAIEENADLIVTHHPLPFYALKRVTTETTPGKLLWQLASHGISVFAPHTAWDSAQLGINAQLADKLGLCEVSPLAPADAAELMGLGSGRIGVFDNAQTLKELVRMLASSVPYCRPRGVDSGKPIHRVAMCCGSGGSLLGDAISQKCDLFLTGEASFHECLEAEAAGCSLLLIGHFASERFAMEQLARMLSEAMPELEVWPSRRERDPVVDLS